MNRRALLSGILSVAAGAIILPASIRENAEAARKFWALDQTMLTPAAPHPCPIENGWVLVDRFLNDTEPDESQAIQRAVEYALQWGAQGVQFSAGAYRTSEPIVAVSHLALRGWVEPTPHIIGEPAVSAVTIIENSADYAFVVPQGVHGASISYFHVYQMS